MKSFLICLFVVGLAFADKVEQRKEHGGEHVERHREEEHKGSEKKEQQQQDFGKYKLDERTKQLLLKEKVEHPELVIKKALEFFLNNPTRQFERQCFAKFKPGESVDFVIDLAPSPSSDKWDKWSAESPIAYFLDLKRETPTRAYFNAIQFFIEAVTFDMKPEATHTIIYDNGEKYFIRGRKIETSELAVGEFSDSMRNLKTMWPVATKSIPDTILHSVIKNNLGRMTKLALWNRDNGLPTVLSASRRSKPIFSVVITDGSSGAKINDLVEDLSRTIVIDLGNRRFVKNLSWDEMRRLTTVVTLEAPQQLSGMIDTCRLMTCRACGC